VSAASDARRAAILAFLDGRGWQQWGAIKTHLIATGHNTGHRLRADIFSDLSWLIRNAHVEREAVPGLRNGNGAPVYSYRRVRS
jgi:hypothetical protein